MEKRRGTYADCTRDTLVLPDIRLTLLYFGTSTFLDGLHAHVLLTATELRSIDGNEESLDTSFLSMLDVSLGDPPVPVHVQLDEEGLVW